MVQIKITKENSSQRVDKYVRKYLNDAPLSFIYKLFRKKDVKINNHWVKENYILSEGDELKIFVTDEQIAEFNKPKKIEDIKTNINIIYEDKNILIINKPKGLLIHGDISEKRITLSNMVLSYLYNKGEYKNDGKSFIPSPVHRLDRNTSGVVVFAKNLSTSQTLMEVFKIHENVSKSYLLLACGKVDENGEINVPLLKDENEGFVKVGSLANGAKSAITKYKRISYSSDLSFVEANLITGRTHQLRVHFAYINHPIIGDQKYGDFKRNKEFDNKFDYHYQFLHAYKIAFYKLDGELAYLNGKVFIARINNKEINILNELGFKNPAETQYF
ncbi:MAG: RluA family pseudouridine synthase [Bacilli bacterium]|nr:RluA family pseudouridine synthase [Bacilli bacterium]